MDKLEPILKHHFWILLVPLLSMNLWGYFSANSALKEETKKRVSAIDSAKNGVPNGADSPNEKYSEELAKQNEALKKYVDEELGQLWGRQLSRMTWPSAVAASIPKKHRDEIDSRVRFTYQNIYQNDVIKPLFTSVEPVVPNPKDLTYVPKVDFPYQLIPQMKLGNFTVTSQQVWDAQEDVWVTQLILDAIRQMNKDADSTSSAVIRRVISYRLLGGDGTPVAGAAAAGGSADMGSSSMMMGTDSGSTGAAPGGPMGGGAGGAPTVQTSVRFNPAEEFGIGGEAQANTGMEGGALTMSSLSSGMPAGDEAAATGATEILRYVKNDESAKYMERGFYLSVIINQNKLVDFLVALSNSEWPVRVVRFQFGKNPYRSDDFKTQGAGGGGNMAAMGMGTPSGLGSFGAGDPASSSGYAPSEPGLGSLGSLGSFGGASGGEFGTGMGMGANTGYNIRDLDHPDLIQLDLCGLVTIFRQPAPEEGSTEGTTPAEGAPSTESPASPDGQPQAAAPAGETPAGATSTAEGASPPSDPASPTAPSPDAAPAATPADGTAAPAEGGAPAPQAPSAEAAPPEANPGNPTEGAAPAPAAEPSTTPDAPANP